MRNGLVTYDYARMLADRAAGGTPNADLELIMRELERAHAALDEQWRAKKVGFFSIPERRDDLRLVERMAHDVAKRFGSLIVIGIGGSELGARAIIRALKTRGKGMDVHFIGANTDPEEIAALLARVDLEDCALNVISKSGDTVEPMAAFLLLRERLIKRVGEKRHREHVIATTDPKEGTLRAIADREGYRTLPVPADIGGRWSALTPVGLFPAACAGIPVVKLIAGGAKMRDEFFESAPADNGALMFAGLHHDGYRRGERITVLMPYADALKDFAVWFRQLWAESLGKKLDRRGNVVHHGLTPVAALGAADQHSQIQLYNEGPADKIVTFLGIESFRDDFKVPKPYPDLGGISYLGGHAFGKINAAEREATAAALAKSGRPSGTMTIPKITPESFGALLFFFMLATAAMAELLDIDAYDQPGVEEGKRMIETMLGRKK